MTDETCVLLSHQKVEKWGYIDYEPQNSDYLKDCNFQATYADVTEWVMKTYGEHVSNLNIAQVKDKCGFEKRENYNKGKDMSECKWSLLVKIKHQKNYEMPAVNL